LDDLWKWGGGNKWGCDEDLKAMENEKGGCDLIKSSLITYFSL